MDKNEIKDCSFTPQINTKHCKLRTDFDSTLDLFNLKSFLNSSKRGSIHSISTQTKYVDLYLANPKKKVEKDPDLIRYEKEQVECTFKPKLRPKSNHMMRSQNLS